MKDIKGVIEKTLSIPEILELTGNKKIYYIIAPKPNPPYVEYRIVNEEGEEWAENKEIATSYFIQVDIFSKDENYFELEKRIKEHMEDAGFNRTMAVDLYENDTKLYHRAIRFNICLTTK